MSRGRSSNLSSLNNARAKKTDINVQLRLPLLSDLLLHPLQKIFTHLLCISPSILLVRGFGNTIIMFNPLESVRTK